MVHWFSPRQYQGWLLLRKETRQWRLWSCLPGKTQKEWYALYSPLNFYSYDCRCQGCSEGDVKGEDPGLWVFQKWNCNPETTCSFNLNNHFRITPILSNCMKLGKPIEFAFLSQSKQYLVLKRYLGFAKAGSFSTTLLRLKHLLKPKHLKLWNRRFMLFTTCIKCPFAIGTLKVLSYLGI